MNLQGFTSTSLSKDSALNFATNGVDPSSTLQKVAILLEIKISGSKQYFYLNSKEYSSYPNEQEVLLQEGIKYKVIELDELTVSKIINDE